ncbi:MAG TPA: hypothetical protein VHM69_10965, partial [Rubrobacter sp.]|nr:hypothetical protein [Rubrobacter sp.]
MKPRVTRVQITQYGRWLPTARIAWVVAAVLVVGTYGAAMPVAYATYHAYAPYKLAAEVIYALV